MAGSVRSSVVPAADVIVIGGGIVGAASAAHLAATGRRVLLIERDDIGAGASGRNSGVVQHPFDPVLVGLHLDTLALYRDLAANDPTLRLPPEPAGLLMVTHDAGLAHRLSLELAGSHPGLSPVFLDADDAHALEPTLARDVSACRVDIGYPVAPAAATRAYAAWAADLGVDIRLGDSARPWLEAGRVAGVELADGARLASADVIVAAGPWTPELIAPDGAWRPIVRSWGVVVTMALADPPRHVLEEAEIDIEPGSGPAEVDAAEPGAAFSLITADGASSLGSTFLEDEPDAAALAPTLIVRGATFVPAVATARVGAHRLCARPLSVDGRPLVGRVPGIDGLWVAAGHGPWGISTGAATGKLIADLVDGRVAAPPAALDPGRFPAPTVG